MAETTRTKPTLEELNQILSGPDFKLVVQEDGSIRAEEVPQEPTPEEQLQRTKEEEDALKQLTLLYQENATLKADKKKAETEMQEAKNAAAFAFVEAKKAQDAVLSAQTLAERQIATLKAKDEQYAQLEEKLKKSENKVKDLETKDTEKAAQLNELGTLKYHAELTARDKEKAAKFEAQEKRNAWAESKGLKHELKRICILIQGGAVYGNRDTGPNDELTSLVDGAAGRVLVEEEAVTDGK